MSEQAEYVFAPHGTAPAGPCGFCGYPDKRHRMWDAIKGRFAAGESIDEIGKDYNMPRRIVEQWLRLAVTAPKRPRSKKSEYVETGEKVLIVHRPTTGQALALGEPKP